MTRKQRLLLIGGGHAHLFVLEALRQRRPEWSDRIDVTLLSHDTHLTYTGMLPGLVAGHYRPSECRIDLEPLTESAGVALVPGAVDRLDLARNVAMANGQEWPFDIVSLNIGGASPQSGVTGAGAHSLAVKPTGLFLERWNALQAEIASAGHAVHMVIVGGGAGGTEIALAMAYRLRAYRDRVKWSLVTRGELLPGYPRRAARLMARRLAAAGVALRTGAEVMHVEHDRLHFRDGSSAAFDALLWATGAAPQDWIGGSGIACVDGGFIQINGLLQSTSHPHVFAVGDIATNPDNRRPKAGVFAVRQGPVLADNLLRFAAGQPLSVYHPQRNYLSLLSTGGRRAIASWYGLAWDGEWVWRWKDRIDRSFINRFTPPFT